MRLSVFALASYLLATAPALAAGFRQITIADPGHAPIQADLWYPSGVPPRPQALGLLQQSVAQGAPVEGRGLGLIVISHGTGGNAANHIDTARALADAGFVVVAPTHTGDSTNDQSRVLQIWERPRLLHVVLDYMLGQWPDRARINPARVGAFGFSAGGFTVLVAAGATPDFALISQHCDQHKDEWSCQLIASRRKPGEAPVAPPASAWVHDARVRAAVVAAPALGYTFGKPGLADIKIPIQLWRAADDHILPQPYYAQAVADDLPVKPDYRVVANAGHLDFLTPCSAALAKVAPVICTSAPGFDRAKFHVAFNQDLVKFFQTELK
jgi:predicted dienelactone hydrolase